MIAKTLVLIGLLSVSKRCTEENQPFTSIEPRKQIGKKNRKYGGKDSLEKLYEFDLDTEEDFRDEKNLAVATSK